MKKLWIVIGIVVIVALAIVFSVTQTKKAPKEIKIGAILPLSGPTAWLGEMHKWGIDLAVEEINSRGGVNGRKIDVVYEDDQNEPLKAVNAFRKMVTTIKPPLVITAMSSSGMAIRPLARENKTILFANGNHPGLVKGNEWVFRIFLTSEQEAKAMAKVAFKDLGLKRVAVLYINDASGEGGKNVFEKYYTELGGKIPIAEKYDKNGTDFRSEITKVLGTKPTAVYVIGYGNAAGKVLNQLREMGYGGLILGTSNFAGPPLTEIAAGPLEKSIFTTPYFDPRLPDSTIQEFVRKIKTRVGKIPQWNTVMEYDGMYIIRDALMHSNSLRSEDIRNVLMKIKTFSGMAGKYRYEEREWLPETLVRTYVNKQLKNYNP